MELAYVAPKFFRVSPVQSWLGEKDVQIDIVSLARASVLGHLAGGQAEARKRLSESYSKHTGEPEHSGEHPINAVVSSLIAGFFASIPRNQQSLAGVFQAVSSQVEGFDRKLDRLLERYPVVRSTHTKVAEEELSAILALTMIDPGDALERVGNLWRRVDGRDLDAVSERVKTSVRYWASRLRASTFEAADDARSLRQGLSDGDMDESLHVLDALIKAADADADGALRMLRKEENPDARSVLLSLIVRFRGVQAALEWFADLQPEEDPEHFTAIGWRDWAVCLGSVGRWREAADGLRALASSSNWGPGLASIEGVVNAALLIPEEHRKSVFEGIPAYREAAPNLGGEARARHGRAKECFGHAVRCLSDKASEGLRNLLADWCAWVDLMDPVAARADLARSGIRERLERGDMRAGLISLAWAFGIEFNTKKLDARLVRLKRLGGLGRDELLVEVLLNHRSMSAREFATYLEGRTERLDHVISKSVTTAMLFEALLSDGQVERARAMVEKRRAHVDEELAARLDVALDAEGGTDPRGRLGAMYRESDELVDLKNLIAHLMSVDDREALRPLLRALFNREPTLEHAYAVVRWLGHPPADHGAILEFLEANPTVVEGSDDMRSALAWALFGMGRTPESRVIIDALLTDRHSRTDLELDLNIALATGDWERISAIVGREWPRRSERDADILILLARLASQVGHSAERAIQLAKLATEKAPANPQVLAEALAIHLELGREADADPSWWEQALASSSAEEGPVWQADLQQFVNDLLPRVRERNEQIDRMLMGGEVPLALAAGVLNMPLSRILLSSQSGKLLDGRSRAVVPIISALRHSVDLQEGWTVGMDLTSIMVLSRLGLLKTALGAFSHVKLAPDAMACLVADRASVRFHQPTRVDSASYVRRLIDQSRIKVVDQLKSPPTSLAEEVGTELATLLEACAGGRGVVVCVRPIHRAGSLNDEVADTAAYDEFILSLADLCSMAHRAGLTDTDQDKRAKIFLAGEGQTAVGGLSSSSLSGPIYMHSLALSYLQAAQVLAAIANRGLDLRIHPNVADEMNALVDAGDAGEKLSIAIESIRDTLRAEMESRKLTLLPLQPERNRESRALESVNSLTGLIFGSAECDALCVDDRFVNARVRVESSTGKLAPVVCVLDVLRHLHARGVISDERYWGARHKLREAGFAFIPVESEELLKHLSVAEFEDGRMLESAELRVIRQTVNRIASLELLSGGEARAMGERMTLACREVIQRLWANAELEAPVAGALCSWVWEHLGMETFLLRQGSEEDGSSAALRDGVVRRLSLLLVPPIMDSPSRRSAYREWLEQSVLAALRPANEDVIEDAATAIRSMFKGSGKIERVVARLFFECLPEALRGRIVNADPMFAEDFGFSLTQRVEFAGSLSIAVPDLLNAARTVYAGARTAPLADIRGAGAVLARAGDDETLVASWIDAQGERRRVQVPELTLVSGNAESRIRVLNEIVGRVGPTARGTRALLEHASSRRLTDDEIAVVLVEETTGVAAVQSRLLRKIARGWHTNLVDIVPPSRIYWERFCGPVPDRPDAETYFREQLIPYRKELIEADLRVGLDIGCLGALRDDLSPGAWLDGIDDETVWDALTSLPAQGNPIALLAVLDVALYRAGDDRFQRLADDTMGMLLDDHLGLPADFDVYRLFEVLADFEMDRLGLVEGADRYPGFWRRICAWMQAGLIVRMALVGRAVPEVGLLEEWCNQHRLPAGFLRRLADFQAEPLVLGHMRPARTLRHEVLGRLVRLKERHEKAGRSLPKAAQIESAQSHTGWNGSGSEPVVPGPAAMHLRPHGPTPDDIANTLAKAWKVESLAVALALTAHLSQWFLLDDSQLAKVREALPSIAEQAGNEDLGSVANHLHAASIVAAAARDTGLANSIGEVVSKLVGRVSRPEELTSIVRVLFQAAAGHAEESQWGRWLDTHLAEVAEQLPMDPSECKQWLWYLLDSMAVVLPIRDWVHLRAKQKAGVALEAAP